MDSVMVAGRSVALKRLNTVLVRLLVGFGLMMSSTCLLAQELPAAAVEGLLTRMGLSAAERELTQVQPSPIPGLYQVTFISGSTIYITEDGSHFVAGDLFRVEDSDVVNLSEEQRKVGRAELIGRVPLKEQIVFPAKGEAKAFVTVFTDIDCGYCAKLHREVPELNAMGIEVRYLAYPRAGLRSPSYDKIATAWCADDPQETLTRLKARDNSVKMAVCEDNPVASHLQLGQRVGVRGTPALVTEAGDLLPGYMPALKLAQTLGVN